MKKFFSIIALAAAFGFAPVANAVEFDDGIYHFNNIIHGNDNGTNVMISLAADATVPANVVMPTTVTYEGVTYTVTHVKDKIFSNNNTIVSVKLPEQLRYLEDAAFEHCKLLQKVEFPSTLLWIGGWCCTGCSSLNNVVLPESLTYIGQDAFSWGPIIGDELIVPDAVTSIGNNAFSGSKIKKIVFGTGVTTIPTGLCAWCPVNAAVIPENVKTIQSFAFQGAQMAQVNLGKPETLEANIFADCGNLKEVGVEAVEPPACVESTFPAATYEGKLVVVSEAAKAAYQANAVWGKFATIEVTTMTGVDEVAAAEAGAAVAYNLYGVKVADDIKNVTTPGIYIAGGKKVLVK